MRDWLYSYYCGAGLRARARYLGASKRWQTRVLRRPRLVLIGLTTLTVVVATAARHDLWAFAAGMILGALAMGFGILRDSPPAYIEQWRTGWEGERRTARALAPLRRLGCALLHDLSDRGSAGRATKGNIDHVVITPAGVFLLDTKWLGGAVTIDGETVRVRRRDIDDDSYRDRALARTMRARAARLQEDIAPQSGVRFVQPVVVFWGIFEAGEVNSGGVTFIHGDRLAGWLRNQRQTMTVERVAQIAACVERYRPSEPGPLWARVLQLLAGRDRPQAVWAMEQAHGR